MAATMNMRMLIQSTVDVPLSSFSMLSFLPSSSAYYLIRSMENASCMNFKNDVNCFGKLNWPSKFSMKVNSCIVMSTRIVIFAETPRIITASSYTLMMTF